MQIPIVNAQFNTVIFEIIFWGAVILSIRKVKTDAIFAPFKTQEIKGFAILAIIFSHIGYFLSTDTRFLYPMSVLAGVGVNLFLFLSGFGLAVSSIRKPLTIQGFYFRRLKKLFIPLWFIVSMFLILDYFTLGRSYQFSEIWKSFSGFFPVADLFKNLNSPLWYFTLILFYYLIFPWTFFKRIPYLAPVLIIGLTYMLLKIELPFEVSRDVMNLYKTHFAAFPFGVLFAVIINDESLNHLKGKFKEIFLKSNLKYLLIIIFGLLFGYFSINSGVGDSKNIEQTISLLTMFSIIFLFVIKNFEIKLFTIFGIYSYEIYLIHWPILSRYDYLYIYLPAWLATVLYLILFLTLGYLLSKVVKRVER